MPSKNSQKNVISGEGTLCNNPIKIVPPPQGVEFGKYCAIAPNLKIMGINHDQVADDRVMSNFPWASKSLAMQRNQRRYRTTDKMNPKKMKNNLSLLF